MTGVRPQQPRPAGSRPRGVRFALFGETLLVGVLVLVSVVPLVTLLAALAAGCAHLRAHVDGTGSTRIGTYPARLWAATPGSWPWSLATLATGALLGFDAAVVRTGRLPGGDVVATVCLLAAVALVVVALRAAAGWRPGARWSDLLRAATVRTLRTDPGGTALLGLAIGGLVLVTWQLIPLVVPMTGCVVLAAVAVERRPAARRGPVAPD
ncbi:hypothetical protein [Micromonospora sp. NBC_01813]|uniref:hypothetical protein n=1 Tax=Micromonospora sp. NBC_01813 TaxID=2975988 RepID=UPI002DDACD66|nr:hypothetical protein [Micromonospora sp. NBC_01813]WSA10684.1 hypothetical protein OG958_07875 [Micromonospora sp. NBC_01813]